RLLARRAQPVPGLSGARAGERPGAAETAGGRLMTPLIPVRVRPAVLLSIALLLAGCASSGGIAPTQALHTAAQAGAARDADTPWPAARWWTAWGDAQLDALIAKGLASQPGIAAVQARITQAEAAADAAGAARRPQVNG